MLEGIEILNQTEIKEAPEWLLLMFLISGIMMIVFLLISMSTGDDITFVFMIISFITFVISLILLNFMDFPTGKYEYQVTIDDSVSMNEFQEKYEIIDVEGKIYTIREKE